jgi:hypothetical protein
MGRSACAAYGTFDGAGIPQPMPPRSWRSDWRRTGTVPSQTGQRGLARLALALFTGCRGPGILALSLANPM